MTAKAIFSDDSEALAHYGVLGMKWGVRHDKKPSGKRDPSKGIGLTAKEQKLFNESNAAYKHHRKVANEVAEKVKKNTYQRSDLKALKKAAIKDLHATEKYARKTGQMSKDGKTYIRARRTQSIVTPVHQTIAVGGSTVASASLGLGHPEIAVPVGAATALGTLGTATLNYKVSAIRSSTATQYHNDLLRANKNRKPIEAYG